LDNPEVQAYVEGIGRNLAAHLPDTSLTFTFAVLSDNHGGPTHEPISLPGGYIFVSSSLILAAQDEAEFAGMLAHAMIHVAARDERITAIKKAIQKLDDFSRIQDAVRSAMPKPVEQRPPTLKRPDER